MAPGPSEVRVHVSSRSPPMHAQPIVLGNVGRDGRSFWPKRSLSVRQFGNSGSVTLLGQFPWRAKNRLQALVSAIIVHRMPTCGRTGLVDTCRIVSTLRELPDATEHVMRPGRSLVQHREMSDLLDEAASFQILARARVQTRPRSLAIATSCGRVWASSFWRALSR